MDHGRTAKILIVDDTPQNLVAVRATVEEMGLATVTARSGREALKSLLAEEFALILLDVQMPDMDGFETARLVRARDKTRHTPIIFITAMHREDADARKGYSLGAVDYIIKPYVPEILKSKIAVFVDLYEKTEEVRRHSELVLEIEKREFETSLAETRRHMEAETYRVRAEHRITQAILEHAPIGILRFDTRLTIQEVNGAFGKQFDVDPALLIRRNLFQALPWLPKQPFRDAVKLGRPYMEREFRVEHQEHDGRSLSDCEDAYFDLTVWPIEGEDETIIGAVVTMVDVGERARLHRQREDFVATLAHDLQTPVIASDRALELLISGAGDRLEPSQLTMVNMLRENNRNLLKMIQQLLDVYRYEAGAHVHYFDHISLALSISTCVGDLAPIAQAHSVNMSVDVESDLFDAWADRTAIGRVLTNLLENAIKYTPRGGEIVVRAYNCPDGVCVEISNPGPGVQAQDLSQLFQRYWHKSKTKDYKASCGLGLYLCKQIIDQHGGRISVASEPGRLTTFSIILPAQAPQGVELHPIEKAVQA